MVSIDYRVRGLALIGAALLVVAVISGTADRTLPGAPVAVPVPAPAVVGDCVGQPIDPSWIVAATSAEVAGVSTYSYPQLGVAPCVGTRYGEVTAVIARPVKPVVTTTKDGTNTSTTVEDSNLDTCRVAGYRYFGIPMSGTDPAPLLANWYPRITAAIGTAAVSPSTRQQAAGQRWLACTVYLPNQYGAIASAAEQQRYDGTLRDALFTGRARDRTGTCVPKNDWSGGQDSEALCSSQHRGEVIADSPHFLGHATTRAELQNTCNQVIRRLTGISDVSRVGLVARLAVRDSDGKLVTATTVPSESTAQCGVTVAGSRALVGSLLAIGNAPIPWAR